MEQACKNGYAYNEMIAKFDMSDTLLSIAFCRSHQEAESLSVCTYAGCIQLASYMHQLVGSRHSRCLGENPKFFWRT